MADTQGNRYSKRDHVERVLVMVKLKNGDDYDADTFHVKYGLGTVFSAGAVIKGVFNIAMDNDEITIKRYCPFPATLIDGKVGKATQRYTKDQSKLICVHGEGRL